LDLDDLFLISFYIFVMEVDVLGLLLFTQLLPDLVTDLLGFFVRALVLFDNLLFVIFHVDLISMSCSLGHHRSFRVLEFLLDHVG